MRQKSRSVGSHGEKVVKDIGRVNYKRTSADQILRKIVKSVVLGSLFRNRSPNLSGSNLGRRPSNSMGSAFGSVG